MGTLNGVVAVSGQWNLTHGKSPADTFFSPVRLWQLSFRQESTFCLTGAAKNCCIAHIMRTMSTMNHTEIAVSAFAKNAAIT